jgi:hypothetical protein
MKPAFPENKVILAQGIGPVEYIPLACVYEAGFEGFHRHAWQRPPLLFLVTGLQKFGH